MLGTKQFVSICICTVSICGLSSLRSDPKNCASSFRFFKHSSGEVSTALDERSALDLWGITNPAKALTNSGFMQGISSRGVQNVSRFVIAQWFYVLPGDRSVHSSVIILHQMPPLKCSTSTGCPHLRLLACSNVVAQDDAQCSTALFEPCSENFLSQDTRCAGK